VTPQKIGRYEIKAELGRGGMATVYHARDPGFDRDVAVKVLPREFLHDPTFRARFQQEARTIAALDHPAIVQVFDVGEEDGQPYLVMRYMPGGSLADHIGRDALSVKETARIVTRIAPALDEAHNKGMIHRDIKPSNILFDQRDAAHLADFGIVKITEATAQLTGAGIVGTPAYMAPEMADPDGLSPLIDIYALGVTLFQALCGELPYNAPTPLGILMAHANKPIPNVRALRPELPEATQMVIERALAKDPFERYQRTGELAAALEVAAASSVGVRPAAPPPPPAPADAPTRDVAESVEEGPASVAVPAPPEDAFSTIPTPPRAEVLPRARVREEPEPATSLGLKVIGTALGWAIAMALGWLAIEAIVPNESSTGWTSYLVLREVAWEVGLVIAGAIGGIATGMALWRRKSHMVQALVALGLSIGWAVAWSVAVWGASSSILATTSSLEFPLGFAFTGYVSWRNFRSIPWMIAGAIAGTLGGAVTGLALRRTSPAVGWQQVIMTGLGWGLGFAIAELIVWEVGRVGGWPTWAVAWAILGAIAGTIGGTIMFWQLNRARRRAAGGGG
jgi:serine/threonine-protein kinase